MPSRDDRERARLAGGSQAALTYCCLNRSQMLSLGYLHRAAPGRLAVRDGRLVGAPLTATTA